MATNNNLLDLISSEGAGSVEDIEMDLDSQPDIDVDADSIHVASPIVADIKSKLEESERARQIRERQWLRNVNSFRGKDSPEALLRESEKSKVFIRTTTVKVKAAYAQIVEALFADNKFPISISDTRVPEGVSEYAHLKTDMEENVPTEQGPQEPQGPLGGIGFEGDGFQVTPGSTQQNANFLGGLSEEYANKEGESVLLEGISRSNESPQISPSQELARRMEKVIHDQLEETKARTETRKAVFEMCLLGTGIIKGPFNVNKTLHRWVDGVYMPETKRTTRSNMVSVWNFYPDPNATCADDMEWAIERHKMNHQQLRALKDRPHFSASAIDRLLRRPGNYERRSFEHTLDESNHTESQVRLYEVLEFWGYVDKELLKEYDIDVSDVEGDYAQVNVWVSGNEVLRVVVNPFIPQRIPYFVVPYEVDPYSIWGTGVPESMEDTQALMNGFMRLAVDNLALAGNLVFDVDDSMLVPGQEMEIYPGKIFRRQGAGPGQAVHGIQFPNTAPANLDMYRNVRQLADEATGIPSFAHGQMGVMSPTRTASGMSMLLNNASLNIKTVIRNIDDYLLKPWGEAYYRWNMQFNDKVDIKGDLEVRATGSSSMQAKEVRSQRLNTFLQLSANPAIAPMIKFPTVIRELAISMDIDPEEILNNPDEAMIYAQIVGAQNAQQNGAPPLPPNPGMSMPGEEGFTGNVAGAGNELGINGGMMGGMTGEAIPT
jgi:hypothetical protein